MSSAQTAIATIAAGTTILIPSGPSGHHLFVSIFEVRQIDGKLKLLLAPIETQVPKHETTCMLISGDHEFVKHPSFIGYRHCRIEDLDHVLRCINSGVYKCDGKPISAGLLERIKSGYKESKRIPKYIRADWGEVL